MEDIEMTKKRAEIACAIVRDLEEEVEGKKEKIKIQVEKVNLAKGKISKYDKKLSFLVHCNEDRRELMALFERLRMQRKPTMFTCPFTNQKHNI